MKYWRSIEEFEKQKNGEELIKSPEFNESSDDDNIQGTSRRDFMKSLGFGIGFVALVSSCEMAVRKAIPYLNKPEEILPGVANHYASTYFDGSDYCSVLVKTREGRPIKIEGNDLSSLTNGGTNAKVQASVLSLYDSERLQYPLKSGAKTSWEIIDAEIIGKLQELSSNNESITILTSNIISPSTLSLLDDFVKKYPSAKIVYYDPISLSAIPEANNISFNKKVIPSYQFDQAKTIVSFNADFLGTWLSPIEFTKQYVKNRKLKEGKKDMSYHVHFESGMSLTGSNADRRISIKPSEELSVLLNIFNCLASKANKFANITTSELRFDISEICERLISDKGSSLVISGSNNVDIQLTVNAINQLLNNYGQTIDLNTPVFVKKCDDNELNEFVDDLNTEKIKGLILYNVNAVYDFADPNIIIEGIEKTNFSVAISQTLDETASIVDYVCPDSHYLESWNDAEPKEGYYSLAQPAIQKIFDTRQFQESLLRWSGSEESYYDFIRKYWEENIYPEFSNIGDFDQFWTKSLQEGVTEYEKYKTQPQPKFISSSIAKISPSVVIPSDDFEIILYDKISLGNGQHSNNPWLQELPDPISKICWDNYLSVSPSDAKNIGLEVGDVVIINGNLEAPVFVQPGQAVGTFSLALGYGRLKAGKAGNNVGVNAYPLIKKSGPNFERWNTVSIKKTGKKHLLAQTQTHHSMEGREIVKELSLNEYSSDHDAQKDDQHNEDHAYNTTLYKEFKYDGHHWAMAIDLNSCTGCSNCVLSCQAENNIPIVGKEEVSRVHEMHWLRIDRYYTGDENNPKVVFQPMMCQHCDNAPCENVCPVLATTHSSEGLNQMTYNRCVGTRYCANNCPYKVRRFNWFDYTNVDAMKDNLHDPLGMTSDLKRMVLNPDVTVRAKGVIEKCSFCSQRIQEKKLLAKLENRPLDDGEIVPACAQSCPGNAIVFGDLNDKTSEVAQLFKNNRKYRVLEEIHTEPSIGYLTKISNNGKTNIV